MLMCNVAKFRNTSQALIAFCVKSKCQLELFEGQREICWSISLKNLDLRGDIKTDHLGKLTIFPPLGMIYVKPFT